MADPTDGKPFGDDVLEAVTEAMVAIHERYHGRKPGTAHTQLMGDDMLACMFGEVYTDVEKTMIELQRQALVHETRSAFQRAMDDASSTRSSASPVGASRASSRPTTSAGPRARAVPARTRGVGLTRSWTG